MPASILFGISTSRLLSRKVKIKILSTITVSVVLYGCKNLPLIFKKDALENTWSEHE